MKTLIVLSAVPGSGKSTWANKYQKEHKNTYIISSDEIRKEITGQYQDFSRQKDVWDLFEKRTLDYSKKEEDLTVILDAVIDLDTLRVKYAELGKDYDKKVLVVIIKSLEDIKVFNKERPLEKWVPDEVLNTLYNKFELPSEEVIKLYDEYIFIENKF